MSQPNMFCRYCKVNTNHQIYNCPKLAKKNARRKKEQEELVKHERELDYLKTTYGPDWYVVVEHTEFDCQEAYELRMEDDLCEEEDQKYRKSQMRRRKNNLLRVQKFLDNITAENAKKHTTDLINGQLGISVKDVCKKNNGHHNYNLVLPHIEGVDR